MPRVLIRALLVASVAWLPCVVAATDPATPTEQRARLDTLRERINTLRDVMQSTEGERTQFSHQLQAIELHVGQLARRLRVLGGRLERQQERLEELGRQAASQHSELDGQRAALARQVQAAYAMGRQERLKILLNQQDPALVSRAMAYYDYMNRARAERMQRIHEHLAELARTESAIRDEEAKLRQLRDKQQMEYADLEATRVARKEVVDALSSQLHDQGRELDRLRGDEKQLQTLLEGIERALADIPSMVPAQQSFATQRGKLHWPARGVLRARFGSPKIGSLEWDGVMISAPEGREVRAVHHGRVAFADWLRGFGLLLIIDHGDGYMSLYGHNQSLFKEAGEWVDADEPVALVGNSGGLAVSGMYFGIRHRGKAVDPQRWCVRSRGRRVG